VPSRPEVVVGPGFTLTPEIDAQATLELKGEINTREHASLLGVRRYPFAVENDRYRGTAEIASFEPEELSGTKLRALLQRRRNRDLFDLHHGLEQLPLAPEKVIACFDHYLALEGKPNRRGSPPRRTWRSFAGVRGSRREVRPRFEDIDIS
jgi:hypothetical protein